ncbi:MAG: tRNA (adenosine(37)-N6)-threonylcarbamoyltransferase complex transferase subunit TsaD [Candidatus Latescibacteria bacterium 4484_7]|nr:MAG: tRNA (adenosine(37)-N6)-threonylcarbamoyltransferase complex transferase subunit TsaD [Candidatus Latescibacteria bacterium 4484_7]
MSASGYILGFETSCDDTSCALYSPAEGVVVNKTAAQLEHGKYGGVVPEIASRNHMKTILPLYESVMNEVGLGLGDIRGIGVTHGPGLTGSLLVGLSFAKALAYSSGVPIVGVHHIEGHIMANALSGTFETPALVLVVSGGHTQLIHVKRIGRYELLGQTRDDAAGEAFDKIAKILGLSFPGGPEIERVAAEGDPGAFDFPRALRHSGKLDFSFSGLKTAVRLKVESIGELTPRLVSDVAASAQEAIVDILAEKSREAAKRLGVKHCYIAGGVAANLRLRERMSMRLEPLGVEVRWPETRYCTDNAAMIACAAYHHLEAGLHCGLDLNTFPRGELTSWA